MTPEQINELINRLLNTGEILASKGFELAYRQVLIEGWLSVIVGTVVAILAFILAVYMYRHNDDENSFFEDCAPFHFIPLVAGIAMILLPVLDGVQQLLNPAWYAVKLLVETFIQ